MSYSHLTLELRKLIELNLSQGVSIRKIASFIGFSSAAVSFEIKRNSIRKSDKRPRYDAAYAHRKATKRRRYASKRKHEHSFELIEFIKLGLNKKWSPEQIVGRWNRQFPRRKGVCFKTIYRWLKEGSYAKQGNEWTGFARHLRIKGPGKRCVHGSPRKSSIGNLPALSERPRSAKTKSRYGHWECDLICGYKRSGYIFTAVDRKSGFLVAGFCKDKSSSTINHVILSLFKGVPLNFVRSFTFDRGKEFFGYEELQAKLHTKAYFCDPQSPTQRALNENTNGLLRQYFPKKMSFSDLTQEKVKWAAAQINNRPRKKFGYKTTVEVVRRANFDRLLNFA